MVLCLAVGTWLVKVMPHNCLPAFECKHGDNSCENGGSLGGLLLVSLAGNGLQELHVAFCFLHRNL